MKAVAGNYIIQTVSRALDLLEQFQENDTEYGLTDLSNRMKLQKNNVFRLVATLKERNYIELNNSTGKYRLGMQTRALGQFATRQFNFENQARPFLDDLKQKSLEACYFSVIKGGDTYYLDGVETDLPVRVSQRIGSCRPVYCTAAGRVQLAFMAPQKRMDLLAGLEMKGFTDRTITDPEKLRIELKKVAKQGYSIDDQEHDAGVMEIAAPVYDSNGEVVGALSILGPEMRLAGARLESELIPFLCQNAARFSAALGHCRTRKVLAEISLPSPKPKMKTKRVTAKSYVFGGYKSC